jgi:hypothetical protein
MGFDYRLGYLDATWTEGLENPPSHRPNAVEVALEYASPGDVLQIADDNYTEPDADYPGLHTFIIAEVVEPGVFNGWDSNSNWDGIVRWREGYDPRVVAGRYPNLNFRIYRFPTPENPAPEPSALYIAPKARPLAPGDSASVVADGDTLNLRTGAGLDQGILGQLADGAIVTVTGEPIRADGHTWLPVRSSAGSGWVASEYLRYRSATDESGSAAVADSGSQPLFSYRALVPFIAIGD